MIIKIHPEGDVNVWAGFMRSHPAVVETLHFKLMEPLEEKSGGHQSH